MPRKPRQTGDDRTDAASARALFRDLVKNRCTVPKDLSNDGLLLHIAKDLLAPYCLQLATFLLNE